MALRPDLTPDAARSPYSPSLRLDPHPRLLPDVGTIARRQLLLPARVVDVDHPKFTTRQLSHVPRDPQVPRHLSWSIEIVRAQKVERVTGSGAARLRRPRTARHRSSRPAASARRGRMAC